MLIKASKITSCYLGPQISPEQFIKEHFFVYLEKGKMDGYDGSKRYVINSGQSCIVRKNHLARYHKTRQDGEFEKVVIIFDEIFLKKFQQKYQTKIGEPAVNGAFFMLGPSKMVSHFLQSLSMYYNENGKIDAEFTDLKREELLLILLKEQPELASVLFEFGMPEKIDLKSFIQKNYRFNVKIERLAYLTGRSLSAFKRDFKTIFKDTPMRWLIQKRLEEAHFLLENKKMKPSDVYLDLGFEDFSHFSFTFKKKFGYTPRELSNRL